MRKQGRPSRSGELIFANIPASFGGTAALATKTIILLEQLRKSF